MLNRKLKVVSLFFREDIFKKVLSKALGVIYKVKIRSDNAGVFPGWFLNKVIIQLHFC